MRPLPDRNSDFGGAGVLFAVVQGFLHDAVDAGLGGVGKTVGDAFFDEFAGDGVAPQEIFELELESGNEAEIVE